MEQLNLGSEAVKSSRRFSSILKASQTSMKKVGAEQEKPQEEVTKPIEKKRNSRRVSFATTNNVRVFSNDAKSESPVLASIQNTTVRDGRQDKKILHFVEEGNHQIKGLENLLNNPLYVSQHLNKENFFSDPLLQNDCVDRTILLGEDTGFMDITHSHTITIDNDYEVDDDDEPKPDFGLRVAQMLRRNQNIASQSGLSCSAKVVTKNNTMDPDSNAFLTSISQLNVKNILPSSSQLELGDMDITQRNTIIIDRDCEINDQPNLEVVGGNQNVPSKTLVSCEAKIETNNSTVDSDFNAFLASISLPAVKHIAPPSSKKRLCGLFSSVNTGSSEIEKENVLSSFLEKEVQHPGGKGNPQQLQGLQRRRSRVAFLVDNDMEATTSHTVVIEKGNAQPVQSSVSEIHGNILLTSFSNDDDNDMELTQCQTAPINVKFTANIPRNIKSALNHNRSHYFSENDNAMELTGFFDVSVQEKEHAISKNEDAPLPVPIVSKMFFNEIMDKNQPETNQTSNFGDMEMTETLDVSVQGKEHMLRMKDEAVLTIPSEIKMPFMNVNGNWANLSIAQTDHSDDMDMTQCQTIVLETKQSSVNKPFSNSSKCLPYASVSKAVQEKDHTANFGKIAFNLIGNGAIVDHNKSGNLSIAQTTSCDDMDRTRCQTIIIGTEQSFSSSMKCLPHASVSRTRIYRDTEYTVSMKEEALLSVPRTSNISLNMIENGEIMDHNKSSNRVIAQISGSDDMKMTQSQINILENKQPRKSLPHPSVSGTEGSDGMDMSTNISATKRVPSSVNETITLIEPMEMTEVQILPIIERNHEAFITRRKSTMTERGMMSLCDPENTSDMEMTQCQTVVLESKNCERGKPVSKSRRSLNLVSASSSPDVDCMEMTQSLTGNIRLKSLISTERNMLPAAQSCLMQDQTDCMELTLQASALRTAMPSVDDEMELTGSNTIAIDAKSTLAASVSEIKANESVLRASTSVTTSTVLKREQNEKSEAASSGINQEIFPPENVLFAQKSDLEGKNPKNEVNNMQVSKVLTMPIETQNNVSFYQKEVDYIETLSGTRNVDVGHGPWLSKEQSANSVQLDVSSSTVSVADSFIKEELQHAKSRRRSLADFQMELLNMSRHINVEKDVMWGSTTAPLPSCSLQEISLNDKEQRETVGSTEQASNFTPMNKRKDYSVKKEKTTPFSLKKKPFSSRLSLCGIVPKLPKQTTVTPNKIVTITTNGLQCLPLDKHFNVKEQNSNCKTVNINDEEFPDMSSEEDLSGSLECWPVNKKDECSESLTEHINEEPFNDDVFESNMNKSQVLKRLYTEEGYVTEEPTKKACISEMGLACHEAAVEWEGNVPSHSTQNHKAKTIEETGVSESNDFQKFPV